MNRILKKDILRILDANFNRSREGLRVCEEIARFMLGSPSITSELKSARHGISFVMKGLPDGFGKLVESRDPEGDIGRASRYKSEMNRVGPCDIFCANMERVKESLRVLEEFLKLVDKKASGRFSTLRFKVYGIEKKAVKRILALRDTR
ncbi:MAG: thiamine-phosphate pyrophosphorylase [Candidatus Omnitrophota bacterium]|nr:thiamine-phosphate pyrophosphorylase [Candidatus Omnitrophota bacterium]